MRDCVTVHTSGQAPARSRRRTHVPEPYDFRRPMTMAREHARVLEMALETFARQWGNQLTARLRALAQVTFDGLTLTSYDEYVRTLPATTAMMLCTVEQTRQTAVVQVPVSATMVWVDYLLGGPGTGTGTGDGRELTEIEFTLVRGLMQAALGDLGYAFTSLTPLDVTVRSVQYNPQFVQAVPAPDAVLVATFMLHVGEREDLATMMFPAEVLLAPLRLHDGTGGRSVEDQRAHELAAGDLEAAVEEVPVEVAVRFRPVTVRPRDVVDLEVGSVIPLSHPSSQPLDVVTGGVVLARAAAGNNGSRLACMVVTVEEKP
ncbi:MAG TPA: FliM/FliN family flagellar motor switch protein [Friedmanniella sp.]